MLGAVRSPGVTLTLFFQPFKQTRFAQFSSCVSFCVLSPPTEQIDEGLAGKQRQFEGWIHNLNKELNHYKAVNMELSNKLKEFSGSAGQQKEHIKGK